MTNLPERLWRSWLTSSLRSGSGLNARFRCLSRWGDNFRDPAASVGGVPSAYAPLGAQQMPRPIFIVGCPRSGTTLLRDLLRAHPNLTFPRESRFIARFYRAYGEPASQVDVQRLARRILSFLRFRHVRITATPADFVDCCTFADVTRRVFEVWAAKEGKPRWGDKTPNYVYDIPLLLRLFPTAQVIHIIRDGRDVAVSWLCTDFGPGNCYRAARMWKEWVAAGRRDGAALPPGSYIELRYENLLADPEGTLRGVCEFLGETFDPAVLKPHRGGAGGVGKPNPTFRPEFRDSIAKANSGGWRNAMSRRQRAIFEGVADGLLAELGYPCEGIGRKISQVEALVWEAESHAVVLGREVLKLRDPDYRRAAVSLMWNFMRRQLPGARSVDPVRE